MPREGIKANLPAHHPRPPGRCPPWSNSFPTTYLVYYLFSFGCFLLTTKSVCGLHFYMCVCCTHMLYLCVSVLHMFVCMCIMCARMCVFVCLYVCYRYICNVCFVHICAYVYLCVLHVYCTVYTCICLCVLYVCVHVYARCTYVCCTCICMCAWGTLTHVCTCEGQRSTSNVLPYCSALFVFRQGLSLNQSLPFVTIDWPVSPWDLPVSTISIVPSAGR